MKTFRHKKLQKLSTDKTGTLMSLTYWRYSQAMLNQAIEMYANGQKAGNVFIGLPFIVFGCASIEGLINEELRIAGYDSNSSELEQFAQIFGIPIKGVANAKLTADALIDAPNNKINWFEKLSHSIKRLAQDDNYSVDKNAINQFCALIEVRNCILHYSPQFNSIYEWPQKIQNALARSKVNILAEDWMNTIQQKEFLLWSNNCFLRTICIILKAARREDDAFWQIEFENNPNFSLVKKLYGTSTK